MNSIVVIGELKTGFDSYSQRTDDFSSSLNKKLDFITSFAIKNNAPILVLGGVKDRQADLPSIPSLMMQFYKTPVYVPKSKAKRNGFSSILEAAKCTLDTDTLGIEICDDPSGLPLRLIGGKSNGCWIYYTGDVVDLIAMEDIIRTAVDEHKITGIIANSINNKTSVYGVHCVTPVFRKNDSSNKPSLLLVEGKNIIDVEIQHDCHVFEYENVNYENDRQEESDFVSRLKAETLLIGNESDEMGSQKNLKTLIEENFKQHKISETSQAIIRSLYEHSK